MRWLIRLWQELIRDVILTLGGLAVIGSQVVAEHPNLGLIGAGLGLTAPATYQKLRELGATSATGTPGPPLSPGGPEPPQGKKGDGAVDADFEVVN